MRPYFPPPARRIRIRASSLYCTAYLVCLCCHSVEYTQVPQCPSPIHPIHSAQLALSSAHTVALQSEWYSSHCAPSKCAPPKRGLSILRGAYGLRLAVQVDREELEDDVVAVERVCRLLAEVCIQLLVLIANTRTDSPNNSLNNWLLSASAAFEHSHKPPPPQRCRCYSAWSHRTAVPIREGACLPRYYVMLHVACRMLHVFVCCREILSGPQHSCTRAALTVPSATHQTNGPHARA